MDLPVARPTVNRTADWRTRPALIDELRALPTTEVLLLHRTMVAVEPVLDRGLQRVDLISAEVFAKPSIEPLLAASMWVFLGVGAQDEAYLGLILPDTDSTLTANAAGDEYSPLAELTRDRSWVGLRDAGHLFNTRESDLVITAIALANWHATYTHCPRCGTATEMVQAGWARHCPADDTEHYPRTDPAVIMAVLDEDDRMLLGHSAHWPERRFSTLAGFVEAGEPAEQAVRREVAEEAGIVVGDVIYQGSQPWPFPGSLMLAFEAQALTTRIQVDGVEVTDARWFTREELAAQVANGQVQLPMRTSIARKLIEEWFGGPLG